MNKWLKFLCWISLITILFGAGCRYFIHYIGNYNQCDRFNIDNVELRTGINIPAVKSIDCIYHDSVKRVTFYFDVDKVDLDKYLTDNDFVRDGSLYTKAGNNDRTEWSATFSRSEAALKMRIYYKDVK